MMLFLAIRDAEHTGNSGGFFGLVAGPKENLEPWTATSLCLRENIYRVFNSCLLLAGSILKVV
jgi:hypothetical protein